MPTPKESRAAKVWSKFYQFRGKITNGGLHFGSPDQNMLGRNVRNVKSWQRHNRSLNLASSLVFVTLSDFFWNSKRKCGTFLGCESTGDKDSFKTRPKCSPKPTIKKWQLFGITRRQIIAGVGAEVVDSNDTATTQGQNNQNTLHVMHSVGSVWAQTQRHCATVPHVRSFRFRARFDCRASAKVQQAQTDYMAIHHLCGNSAPYLGHSCHSEVALLRLSTGGFSKVWVWRWEVSEDLKA